MLSRLGVACHVLLFAVLVSFLALAGASTWLLASIAASLLLADLMFILWDTIRCLLPSTKTISVSQRNFLVTGGNSGIGLAVSKCIAREGGNVMLVARNEARLREAADMCRAVCSLPTSKVDYASIDLTSDEGFIEKQVERIEASFGSIDVLINCAGYSIPGEFCELSLQDFKNMMAANYLSAVSITHAVVPKMKARKFGQVVFLSSLAGQMSVYGYSAYSPSKFALRGLAEALVHELTVSNIGVTLVYPADTDTPGFSVENKLKPYVTKLISDDVGVWSSEIVAEMILNGVKARSRTVTVGSDGFLLQALTCGAFLPSGLLEFLAQTLLMPFLRLYMLFLQSFYMNTIKKHLPN